MRSTRACILQKAGRDSQASSLKTNDAHDVRSLEDIMLLYILDHDIF